MKTGPRGNLSGAEAKKGVPTVNFSTARYFSLFRSVRAIRFIQSVGAIAALACVAGASGQAQTYTEAPIYSFNVTGTGGNSPVSSLVQAGDGYFYGTTYEGGSATACGGYGCGTIYKLSADGSKYTVLYTFKDNGDGAQPYVAPIQASDGNFYGTTYGTSGTDAGSVYQLTPSGTFNTLHAFSGGTDGGFPQAMLVQGSDGNIYGTTSAGGNASDCAGMGCGTIFKVTPAGAFSTIYTFTGGTDGGTPIGGLVEDGAGVFYGTTSTAGANSYGTVYKLSGTTVTPVYAFCTQSLCTDGEAPQSTMWVGVNGDLYGSTVRGGSNGSGSVFQLTTSGTLTTIGNFCTQYGCNDGSSTNGIFLGSDGVYYGTTLYGGSSSQGSVYTVTTAGVVTPLISFVGGTDASHPNDAPMQAADGNFYGSSAGGGNYGYGAIWKMTSSPAIAGPVQLTLSASSIQLNSSATLNWKVVNAAATTMQQCYATVQGGLTTGGSWTGKKTGTLSGGTYSGSASLTPTAAGTYTYALTCGGIESGYATLTVNGPKTNSATTMTATPNPATVGQTVSLKATVTGSGATPTGNVAFVFDGITLGTAALNGSGVATLAASSNGQVPGPYAITAEYQGSSTYNSSNATPVTVTLNKAPTATTISANPTSVTPPGTVTLTATVTRTTGTGSPSGSVTFYYTTIALGTAKLNGSGVASFTASSNGIPAGKYGIVAKYAGDAGDAASNSTATTVTVK